MNVVLSLSDEEEMDRSARTLPGVTVGRNPSTDAPPPASYTDDEPRRRKKKKRKSGACISSVWLRMLFQFF